MWNELMLYGACYSIYCVLLASHGCMNVCASVHGCVRAFHFVTLYASVSTQTCPSPSRARMRSAWEELLSYLLICEKLILSHAVQDSIFLCHLLLKHTFPQLFLSYIPSGFSSNSSWAIKLMTSKVNQADTKRSRTFCHKSFSMKLENQDRRKKKLRFCSHTFWNMI